MSTNSLISLLIKVTFDQISADIDFGVEEAYVGLRAYRDYFADRLAGKEPVEFDLSPASDRYLDALDQALTDREALELDAVVLGDDFPTLEHFYLEAFADLVQTAEDSPDGPGAFLSVAIPEMGMSIGTFDRKWLRDELGIRSTPNPVRLTDEITQLLLDDPEVEYGEEMDRVLTAAVAKFPDHPLVSAHFVLYAEEDELAARAENYLRPLFEYPPGRLGFYHDFEVTSNWLAHCRYLLHHDRDLEVLPYAEKLLRFGYDRPLIDTITLGLTTSDLQLTAAQRKEFPLITARLDDPLMLGEETVMNALKQLLSGSEKTAETNQILQLLSDAVDDMELPPFEVPKATIRPLPSRTKSNQIFRVKITIDDSKPPIWRRLELSADTSLRDLHYHIMTIFEWTGGHLHAFESSQRNSYVPPDDPMSFDFASSYAGMTIRDMFDESGKRFAHLYDFGDNWYHLIDLEKEFTAEPGMEYPRCTAGRRAGPLDDVGGIWGYYDFLAALKNPKHEMHEDAIEWFGEDFDPAEFDVAEIDGRLAGKRKQK